MTDITAEERARFVHDQLRLNINASQLRALEEHFSKTEAAARKAALEDAALLHENINPASNDERLNNVPGAGAMGAVIEYRDAIRALAESEKP